MVPTIKAIALGLLLTMAGCVSAPTTDPAQLPAGEWRLDERHASVIWSVRHFGLSWVTGRFDTFRASLSFDPLHPEEAELNAIIEVGSISSGLEGFDETLRGGAWLGATAHPEITFRSTRIEITEGTNGDSTGIAYGELTLKGVSQEAVMEIEFYGGNYNFLEGRQAIGFGADLVINRQDFDVGNLPATIAGNEIRIHIEADFLRERSGAN